MNAVQRARHARRKRQQWAWWERNVSEIALAVALVCGTLILGGLVL